MFAYTHEGKVGEGGEGERERGDERRKRDTAGVEVGV